MNPSVQRIFDYRILAIRLLASQTESIWGFADAPKKNENRCSYEIRDIFHKLYLREPACRAVRLTESRHVLLAAGVGSIRLTAAPDECQVLPSLQTPLHY